MIAAEPWPAADRLFRGDPRWRGGDDAYSIALSPGRILWVFGDSFIAPRAGAARSDCHLVHNSIGLQDGTNPESASMRFFWGADQPSPRAFFADSGDEWFWPGGGVRIEDALVLFLMRVHTAGAADASGVDALELWRRTDSLSFFRITGWDARIVRNIDDDPAHWRVEQARLPSDGLGACVGSAGVHVFGDQLYAFGFELPEAGARWRAPLWSWPLSAAAQGDLSVPANGGKPIAVLEGAPTEFTVHPWNDGLLQVQTTGVFAADIALRTASRPEGPWSPLTFLYHPPEADRSDALVYAAKAHPELDGAELAVTYATIGLSADVTLDDESLYFPRFVRATIGHNAPP